MIPNRMAVTPFHVWKSLLEKAGYETSDIPKTWDAFLDFFPQVAEKLRAQGKRNIYAYSIIISAVGFDAIGHFDHLMIAYGGKDLFTPDGKVHTDDPKVREAAVKVVIDQYRHLSACFTCSSHKPRCTVEKVKRFKRWKHEGVLDAMQARLDRMPEAMGVRRQTV